MRTFAAACLSSACCCFTALAEPITLIPSRDSDVYAFNGFPTSSVTTLGVSTTPTSYSTLHSQKSLVEFNFSSLGIPAEEIESAVLRLFVFPTDPTFGALSPGDVYVHVQGKAWSNTPNWNSFDEREILGVIPKADIQEMVWVEVDITEGVKGWVAGTVPNHGLVLRALEDRTDPVINIAFGSMETAADGLAPQLVITRAEPAPVEPPVLAISGGEGEVVLEWPQAGAEGWTLRWTQDLAGSWEDWEGEVLADSGKWKATAPVNVPKAFFRLEK